MQICASQKYFFIKKNLFCGKILSKCLINPDFQNMLLKNGWMKLEIVVFKNK